MPGKSDLTIVDCTLRDGGYYNNWDFEADLVNAYIAAADSVPVDLIEIGFRFIPDAHFHGAYAFSTDEQLNSLTLPRNAALGVMVNAKDLVQYPDGPKAAVDLLFQAATNSPVQMVRIAAHYREVAALTEGVERLQTLGYRVGLNLMQIGERSDDEIADVARAAAKLQLDVLYFADSLGNMTAERVNHVTQLLRGTWNGAIGIHTHDNMLRALNNTMAAITGGVTWVDATVTGMGRGPGNLCLEYLLLELIDKQGVKYNIYPLVELIHKHFSKLKEHFGWGSNPFYFLSGMYSVHPTYVQEMLADSRYGASEITSALEVLKATGGQSYRPDVLEGANSIFDGPRDGQWSAAGWAAGRDVLLVAKGPGARRHKAAIEHFIERERPRVVALNPNVPIQEIFLDAWVACHPMRLMADARLYSGASKSIIAPISSLPKSLLNKFGDAKQLDYGLEVRSDCFEIRERGCSLPKPLVVAYSLALATAAGAERILLVGFDGYSTDDPRQSEMIDVLEIYLALPEAKPLLALTPTNYPLPQGSVYAPQI